MAEVRRSARRSRNGSASHSARRRPVERSRVGRPTGRRGRPALLARLLLGALALALVVGGWYLSQSGSGSAERAAVIERAQAWTDERVPYSQTAYRGGYRTDCSGFVSMAWGLPENLTTWRIPLVAEEISKDDLEAGDILLDCTSDDRHVVIFEKWANDERTAYWGLESSGHPDIEGAIRRQLPYPYVINGQHYRPYRYVGMDGYWKEVPKTHRQPVRGYSGGKTSDG